MLGRERLTWLVSLLDQHMAVTPTPPEVREAWVQLRAELRSDRKRSERIVPAVATAVQHAAAARDHAEKVIDALSAVPSGDPPPHREE
jgi:hypothetical protein